MSQYIKRELVEKMLEDAQILSDGEYSGYYTEDIRIDDIPTENVVPAEVGYWLNKYKSGYTPSYGFICYRCDCWNERKSTYCPQCGAKMEQ